MENNIYAYCLEKGINHFNDITYNKILKELKNNFKNISFDENFEFSFRLWFFQNFFEKEAERSLNYYLAKGTSTWNSGDKLPFEESVNEKVYIKGDTYMKYIDYLELIDARKSSKSAFILSCISIMIALLSVLYQIFSG